MNQQGKTGILVVCMGNICRSPTAHGVLQGRAAEAGLADALHVDSAGTHGFHVGAPPDRRAREAAALRGYDLSGLKARQIEQGDLQVYDYVLAMDRHNLGMLEAMRGDNAVRAHLALLMDFAPGNEGTEVPDPYYGGVNGFEEVLDLVERGADGLIEHLRARIG